MEERQMQQDGNQESPDGIGVEWEYAFDFGFNLGQVNPSASVLASGMMWGMAYRALASSPSEWAHFDPRDKIQHGSTVRIYVCNIGTTQSGVNVGGLDLTSRISARPNPGQTATAPWNEPPNLTGGSVDGDHKATGLCLASGVPHRLVGHFVADIEGRFALNLELAIGVEGEDRGYVFSQDPELVVGGSNT